MLDVCLVCRIQAEHQPGRTACPRCGGALTVLDAATRHVVPPQSAAVSPSVPSPSPQPAPQVVHSPTTQMPPVQTPSVQTPQQAQTQTGPVQTVPAQPHAPSAQTRTPRRAPSLRWVAHRPPETLPPPVVHRPRQPSATPRYRAVPQWGLIDVVPAGAAADPAATPAATLQRWLGYAWPALAAGAVVQFLRYLMLAVNRTRPIPAWLDLAGLILLWAVGIAATAVAVVALYRFGCWVAAARADSYALVGRSDPRQRLLVVALSVTPFVSVAAVPLLLLEAARAVGGAAASRAERVIAQVGIAWGLVNLVGLLALSYRIAAWSGDSIQTGADAMGWATLAFAVSALFAHWVVGRLPKTVVADDERTAEPSRRLVVIG